MANIAGECSPGFFEVKAGRNSSDIDVRREQSDAY